MKPSERAMRVAGLALTLGICAGAGGLAHAEPGAGPGAYQWVDESGTLHLSDAPTSESAEPYTWKGLVPEAPPRRAPQESTRTVERTLDLDDFRDVEMGPQHLRITVPVPGGWEQVPQRPRAMLFKALRRSWPRCQALDAFLDPRGGGLPLLFVLIDPQFRKPLEGSSLEMLKSRFDQEDEGGWTMGSFWVDRDANAYLAEFQIRSDETPDGERGVAGIVAMTPTHKGGVLMIVYTWVDEFPTYRPLLLRMIRETQLPDQVRIALPGPQVPLPVVPDHLLAFGAGPALGIAIAMVTALLLLMLHTGGWPAVLRRAGHVGIVTLAFCVVPRLARDTVEVREAGVALGLCVFGALLVGWTVEVKRGRAAPSVLGAILAGAAAVAMLGHATVSEPHRWIGTIGGLAALVIVAICLFGTPPSDDSGERQHAK